MNLAFNRYVGYAGEVMNPPFVVKQFAVSPYWLAIGMAVLFCAVVSADESGAPPAAGTEKTGVAGAIDFGRDIRPIFKKHCYQCHGHDAQESGLRLDARGPALAGGDSGEATIVPRDPEKSLLIARVRSEDPSERMPAEGQPLTPQEIDLLVRWVREGAVWPDSEAKADSVPAHWAYRKPVAAIPPKVKDRGWIRNPIDNFVLARLEREGLAPSPEADRYTLIRRVSLDLTGLPPTPEEVDNFIADAQPGAYERVVERLLASPAYGERWARVWLDLARYADSQGYEKDFPRTIWRFRDWVIDAYNRNMPFDEFTIEQLAGDRLPDPSARQLMATAFHRNTMTNTEGGTDDEEFRIAAVVDRVNTTMEVWMGTTMGCAQCHSHKYDPITQREYYQVFAFFNNTEDDDRPDEFPTIPTPTPDEVDQIARWQGELSALRGQLRAGSVEADQSLGSWARSQIEQPARRRIAKLEGKLASIVRTPVLRELPAENRRETHVFVRGSFLNPGEAVEAGVPAVFARSTKKAPTERLGFARWLVSAENPLTARVAVNRFWEKFFGIGLVETSEDFGTQGEPPSHPALLDWLAVEFVRHGWNVKEMHRLMVTSSTYRQLSRETPEQVNRDPYNRLLSRGPRFRLEAEMVRDQALAVSGLLSDKMFGASVMPPQPAGVWQVVYSNQEWKVSQGEDRYRRGLYTFWRRTSPYPSMITFDAPSREFCVLRRVRTNTPLQALVTLNDAVYIDASVSMARRVLDEAGPDFAARLAYGYRLCVTRPPRPEEIQRLRSLYQSELDHYQGDPPAARQLIQAAESGGSTDQGDPAELAAWTILSNVLLNLDETLTKG